MFKSIFSIVMAAAIIVMAGAAKAQDFGLGAVIGEPTGISGKAWTGNRTAIDFAFAITDNNGESFNIHADYLIHDYTVFNITHGKLPLYYGIGGRLKDNHDAHLGLRGVVGLNYIFSRSPLDLFFEVAPVLDLTPESDMDLESGIGMRFYF